MKLKFKMLFVMIFSMMSLMMASASSTQSPSTEVITSYKVVRITPKQSDVDVSHQYLVALLKRALVITEQEFGPSKVEFMPIMLGQGMVLQLLDIGGLLDIVASAPTAERETMFLSVKVPVFMGLLGYRMSIVHPSMLETLKSIKSAEQLKSLKACQGRTWPEVSVFESNAYTVIPVDKYEDMFEYLQTGQCDYFPRAITEGYGELQEYNKKHPDKPLAKFDDFLLYYNMPLVFYTSHDNYELAAQVEYGLQKMIASGELIKLLQNHPVTQSAFPLEKWKDRPIFTLKNNDLPKSMPTYKKHLWLRIGD